MSFFAYLVPVIYLAAIVACILFYRVSLKHYRRVIAEDARTPGCVSEENIAVAKARLKISAVVAAIAAIQFLSFFVIVLIAIYNTIF